MSFGALLKQRRVSRGFSLREVSGRTDVDPAYLSRVEAGKAPPSDLLIERLASVLECSEEELALSAGRLPQSVKTALEKHPRLAAIALRRLADGIVAEPITEYHSPRTRAKSPRRGRATSADVENSGPNSGPALSLFPSEASDLPPNQSSLSPSEEEAIPKQERGIDPRNQLNNLTAREWIPETVSVWVQRGLGALHQDAQIERQHPAPFSFTDVSRLIRFFTKPGETVLDPFLGVGSTLKACALEGRKGIGIELNEHYAALAKTRLSAEVRSLLSNPEDQRVLVGDARSEVKSMAPASVDFLVTSPPYWNILRKEDHKANQERKRHNLDTNYGEDPRDLGNIASYPQFLAELTAILGDCTRLLKPKRYMALIVSDFRDKSRFVMFHADLATALAQVGLFLRGITILYQRHKKVFPYGYPYGFVPNIHHQYILILQRQGPSS